MTKKFDAMRAVVWTREIMMKMESVIGLEIHVELATRTKLFCGCPNRFGGASNSQVCPVCLGLPGVLPVVNREAVTLLLKAGLALGCIIPPKSKFDRKNYFYPDMPKNYQISQYDLPLAVDGKLEITVAGGTRIVAIERIHLEEDTGKSVHVASRNARDARGTLVGGRIGQSDYTLVDYNRAGVPLIEIVTRPDLRSPQEAATFLQKLRLTLQTLGVSDCKMEEGRMRCDANVSVRPSGSTTLGPKVEIKNMNSFKSVRDALTYEIDRQTKAVSGGARIVQETRAWDEDRRVTFSMRSKEEAQDYRYFPDPDLPPFETSALNLNRIAACMPELPDARQKRYREQYGLSEEEAGALVSSLSLSNFFDETMKISDKAKEVCNWLRGEIAAILNARGIDISETRLTPSHLAELVSLIGTGTISGKIAKEMLPELIERGEKPATVVAKRGLLQISDEEELRRLVENALCDPASRAAVEAYLGGNERVIGSLMGKIMKQTGGKANPKLTSRLLKEQLEAIKAR